MKVYQQIIRLLEEGKVDYQIFKHQPVFTSEEASRVRGTKMEQGAKALVMLADKPPVMLVLSAVDKVDTKVFKKLYEVRDLRMASGDAVERLTGTKIGAVPPFGNLFNLPVYVDEGLGENDEIVFNAGLRTRSVKMGYDDWVKLVKPEVGRFGI
jgi:Ala-tRNA(Pro) deacylase